MVGSRFRANASDLGPRRGAKGEFGPALAGHATVALLLAALAAVLVVGVDAGWRGCAPALPRGARSGIGLALRARGYAAGPAPGAADGPSAAHGRSAAAELEERTLEALGREPAAGGAAAGSAGAAGWGFTAVRVVVRERPELGSAVVGELDAGQMVVVAREQDSWLLVGFRQADALRFGWVEQGRVVRPPAGLE